MSDNHLNTITFQSFSGKDQLTKEDYLLLDYMSFKMNIHSLLKRYINFVNLNQYKISNLDDFQTRKIEKYIYENIDENEKKEKRKKT